MSSPVVRPMQPDDWSEVERIYAEGIATGHATFEAAPPPDWARFIASKHEQLCLVADSDDGILGWAAASPVSARPAYQGVAEHSVYVAQTARGQGAGRALLVELIDRSEHAGIWTLQSSIFPENTSSLRLHDQAGFRRVGIRARIARMTYGPTAGQWRDTILVERRRPID